MKPERPLSILWSWLKWWKIHHWTVKFINFRLGPALCLLSGLVVVFLPTKLNLFADFGLVSLLDGLLQALVGFFIAALAAIATFQRPELEEIMGGNPPTILSRNGEIEYLTRRRFLCYLFGYLAGASIAIYLTGIFATCFAPLLHSYGLRHSLFRCIARAVFFGAYGGVLSHMIATALLGLHFLVERMHKPTLETGFIEIEEFRENTTKD